MGEEGFGVVVVVGGIFGALPDSVGAGDSCKGFVAGCVEPTLLAFPTRSFHRDMLFDGVFDILVELVYQIMEVVFRGVISVTGPEHLSR